MKHKLLYFVLAILFYESSSSAQEITMFTGFFGMKYYQDSNQIAKSRVESLLLTDKEAGPLWQKSKNHLTIGWEPLEQRLAF